MFKEMLTKQQKPVFRIYNIEGLQTPAAPLKHGPLFPNSIRSIICGPSNCGKSNLMMSLLYAPNGLKFENVYVYSKSLHQPKYLMLEHVMEGVPEVNYFKFAENADVMAPSQSLGNAIFVFDDVSTDKQNKIWDGTLALIRFYLCRVMQEHRNKWFEITQISWSYSSKMM